MTDSKDPRAAYNEKLRTHRERIDALRNRTDLPGEGARSGFSSQIAALEDRHRAISADVVRLTSTPESEADWDKLRARLDEALEASEKELDELEQEHPKGSS